MRLETIDDSHIKLKMEINGKFCTIPVYWKLHKNTTNGFEASGMRYTMKGPVTKRRRAAGRRAARVFLLVAADNELQSLG